MHINNVVVIVYIVNSCYTYCFLMLPNTFFKYPLKSNTVAIILKENLKQLYEYFNKLMAAKYNYFCRLENIRIFLYRLSICSSSLTCIFCDVIIYLFKLGQWLQKCSCANIDEMYLLAFLQSTYHALKIDT